MVMWMSCVCMRMEVGESEIAQGRCEKKKKKNWSEQRRGSKHGAWPGKKIGAAVVIVKRNTRSHTETHRGFQRSSCCLPGSKIFTLPLLSAAKYQRMLISSYFTNLDPDSDETIYDTQDRRTLFNFPRQCFTMSCTLAT